MRRITLLGGLLTGVVLLAVFAASAAARISDPTASVRQLSRAAARPAVEEGPGVLMGAPQKEHWENGSAECKNGFKECSDEISQGQFVAWPFVAEHTGTVEAIFAVLDGTGTDQHGVRTGIFANRTYNYAEIKFNGELRRAAANCTWTPAEVPGLRSGNPA